MAKLNAKRVIDALHTTKGAVYLAAKHLGVSHTAVYNYVNNYATVRAVKEYYDGELVDLAEVSLRDRILAKEKWAVEFTLQTKGKNRGWQKTTEVTGKDGEPLPTGGVSTINLVLPDNGRLETVDPAEDSDE